MPLHSSAAAAVSGMPPPPGGAAFWKVRPPAQSEQITLERKPYTLPQYQATFWCTRGPITVLKTKTIATW